LIASNGWTLYNISRLTIGRYKFVTGVERSVAICLTYRPTVGRYKYGRTL
jgi:hypothetical protein